MPDDSSLTYSREMEASNADVAGNTWGRMRRIPDNSSPSQAQDKTMPAHLERGRREIPDDSSPPSIYPFFKKISRCHCCQHLAKRCGRHLMMSFPPVISPISEEIIRCQCCRHLSMKRRRTPGNSSPPVVPPIPILRGKDPMRESSTKGRLQ